MRTSRSLGKLAVLLLFAMLMGGGRLAAQAQPEQVTQAGSGQDIGNNQTSASEPAPPGLVHIVPFGRNTSPIKNTFAPSGAHLTYWGGPVISQVHVVAVFWGPNVNTAITAPGAIDQFFTDIVTSRYYDLLTEYSTTGITGAGVPATSSNQSINRGFFDGAFTITPATCNITPPATCTIDDTAIRTELRNQINGGHLPQPVTDAQGNPESFYMIYFPAGVSITAGGVASCVQNGFCAYHSSTPGNLVPKLVPYGVEPDFSTGGCAVGCGGGTLLQKVTTVTSHELSEAVTDSEIGSATSFGPPLAWYDPDPAANPLAEIGDICTGQEVIVTAGLNSYAVQTEFSNLQNDCVSAPPNVNLNVPAGGVTPAVAFDLPLTIQSSAGGFPLSGYTGTVHFTSSDPTAVLPADYTFTATDAGTHAFQGVTLSTLGDQTISVSDTRSAGFVGTATTNVNTTPDLVVSKSHVGNFILGQSGSYTITVSNSGHGPTTAAVTVVDSLPPGLTATAIGGTGWSCTLQTLTCTRADALALGNSYSAITLAVNVAADALSPLTNVATVSGGGETNTANDTAFDITTIARPDLTVFKRHAGVINGDFFQGETGATYTIQVINFGNAPTSAPVTVVDTLPPAGLTATAISGTGWTCTLANLTCTRSDVLGVGSPYPPITVTVDVALDAPANVTNGATVSGGGETNTANNTAHDFTIILPPPAPDLSISISSPAVFVQGQTGTYSISVSNVGTAATTAPVSVTDTLPVGLTATAMTGSGWTCDLPTLTCTRSDALAFNFGYPQITLTVNVATDAPALVTDAATVSGGGDANTANNTASHPTQTAPPLVDFGITPFGASSFGQGQTGSFMIDVFNVGNIASSGLVTVSDTPPAGVTVTAMGGLGWTCTVSNVSCTRSDSLPPGNNYPAITVTVDVAGNAAAQLNTTATVSGGGDGAPGNNTGSLPIFVSPAIQVNPVGSASATVASGGFVVFTLQAAIAAPAGNVTFACSGLPLGTSCSFSPASLTAPQPGAPVNMTVTTTARTASLVDTHFDQKPHNRNALPLLLLLGILATISLLRKTRPRWKLVSGLAGFLLMIALVSCGGGGTSNTIRQNPNGTPAGTYTITATATGANNTAATQTVQLTVR